MQFAKYSFVILMLLFSTLSLSAKSENWEIFSDGKELQSTSNLSHMIIIRPKSVTGQAINIYIDGEYVSSLLSGAYTEELVCSGRHRINLAYTNTTSKYKEKKKGGQWVTFHTSEKHIYSIVKTGKSLKVSAVPAQESQKYLKQFRKKQAHTISRLNKRRCTQPHTTAKGSK